MKKPKILQIGFNKTGTSSLATFFKVNGYKVIGPAMAKLVDENLRNGRCAFEGITFDLSQDLENHASGIYIWKKYKLLYDQYPDEKFILTTRSCEKWVNSRLRHRGGRYARIFMRQNNIEKLEELIYQWKKEFYCYHGEVLNFFEGKSNFYINDLDNINIGALIEFIGPAYKFECKEYPMKNSNNSKKPPNFNLKAFEQLDQEKYFKTNKG